ncbi:MAG TPA: hypothetical protein VMB34_32895 [Acetobacteraceae bacterium]|nr:hypothetical protein [Acetobacteraceae bacterium]
MKRMIFAVAFGDDAYSRVGEPNLAALAPTSTFVHFISMDLPTHCPTVSAGLRGSSSRRILSINHKYITTAAMPRDRSNRGTLAHDPRGMVRHRLPTPPMPHLRTSLDPSGSVSSNSCYIRRLLGDAAASVQAGSCHETSIRQLQS